MSKIDSPLSPIVCTCLELTRDDFVHVIAENKDCDFEQLLERSGAGAKCTACRLDLESIYVEVFDSVASATPVKGRTNADTTPKGSILRRAIRTVFHMIDKVARPHPVMLRDFSPVVAGPNILESVQIANDRLSVDEGHVCNDMFATIILRNADGTVVHEETTNVPAQGALKVNVGDKLQTEAERAGRVSEDGLFWGNLEVRRRWKRPAFRGTTRPQLLIEGRGGVGGVHTQGPSGRRTYWYTALARPDSEKTFISVVNAADRDLRVEVNCPARPELKAFSIPPFGARGVEIDTRDAQANGQDTVAVSVFCDGPCKTHILTASPELDRFSIDHPAES